MVCLELKRQKESYVIVLRRYGIADLFPSRGYTDCEGCFYVVVGFWCFPLQRMSSSSLKLRPNV